MSTYGSLHACIGEEMSNQPDPALYCDHMGCPNGCTVRAGMCESCVAAALIAAREQERDEILEIVTANLHNINELVILLRQRDRGTK